MPTRLEYIQAYAKGWTEGDAKAILAACSPNYLLDDPHERHPVQRHRFEAYFAKLVKEVSRTKLDQPFMEITDVLLNADHSLVSAWWMILGTEVEGSGLIVVSDQGVESEKLAYYEHHDRRD